MLEGFTVSGFFGLVLSLSTAASAVPAPRIGSGGSLPSKPDGLLGLPDGVGDPLDELGDWIFRDTWHVAS
jgi:hypothetical protein